MNEETVDKVLAFFREIIAQLGPAGEQAFQIVKARVIAESLVAMVSGVIILGITLAVANWCHNRIKANNEYNKTQKYSYDKRDNDGYIITAGVGLIAGIMLFIFIVPISIVNLISSDYAAIERILNLVGR